MRQATEERTQDIHVLQLLTQLVQETDRIIRLADDIDQYASTPQVRLALNLIGSEVCNILQILKTSLEPLHQLYELDPGMKAALGRQDPTGNPRQLLTSNPDDFDENSLWAEVKSKSIL